MDKKKETSTADTAVRAEPLTLPPMQHQSRGSAVDTATTTTVPTTPTDAAPARQIKAGDLVGYVLPTGHSVGQVRPAVVVRVWGTLAPGHLPSVNLQVFTDGTNDFPHGQPGALTGLLWATSVPHDQAERRPGTWHWPAEEA